MGSLLKKHGIPFEYEDGLPIIPDILQTPNYSTGDVLAERYEVRELFHGSDGDVYHCFDKKSNVDVALKTIIGPKKTDRITAFAFYLEIERRLQMPTHPNILTLKRIENIDGYYFIISEWVAGDGQYGSSLTDWIARHLFSLSEIVNFLQQICSALAHCHKNLSADGEIYVYGDLKPENILITKDRILKLADFSGGFTQGMVITMGKYFEQFHYVLLPHLSIRKGMPICCIYSELFSWTIPTGKIDEDTPYYSAPQVARWTGNKEELPTAILLQAVNNKDSAADTYAAVFYDLLYKRLNLSGQSIEILDSDMERFLRSFPILFFPLDSNAEGDRRYYPASYALVTALIYDRIISDGISKRERLIKSDLHMSLTDSIETCRKRNVIFSTPVLLNVLFQEGNSLLLKSINAVHDGLGEKWSANIQNYMKAENHRPFVETRLGKQEIMILAKLLAAKDHDLCPHCPAVATEETICRAFPLCRESKTIRDIWLEISSHDVTPERWDEIVKTCKADFCMTTDHEKLEISTNRKE